MLATDHVNARFDELEMALALLVPALERLHEGQVRQRAVIVRGDLRPLLAITAELDDASVRVERLEQRRRAIQASLEAELGVEGLRALVARADTAHRGRLLVLLDQLGTVVPNLQEQGGRNAALLGSAIDLARRTRATLERLSGTNATYDPLKARRTLAARRGTARSASPSPPTSAPATPAHVTSAPTPLAPAPPTSALLAPLAPAPATSAPTAPSAMEAP